MCMLLVWLSGREGCERIGVLMVGLSISESVKLLVKYMLIVLMFLLL